MKNTILLFLFVGFPGSLLGDGIMIPSGESYPDEFLRNKTTEISVTINGFIAETVVYQEFKNEWYNPVDAVYSFPLPQGARATRLQYTLNDTLVDAVLKIQQQVVNPGTGSGGVVSEVNRYLGSNVLRIRLNDISPFELKGVRLSYISLLKNYAGNFEYRYPFNTGDFIRHPLDYLKINILVNSSRQIVDFNLSSHPDYRVLTSEPNEVELEFIKSKSYAATDVVFSYRVENSPFGIDLFSYREQNDDGYFTLVGKPPLDAADTSIHHNIVFILSNANTMTGMKLDQSKKALSFAINELSVRDSFNILTCSGDVEQWASGLVAVTPENIEAVRVYIEQVKAGSGNRLDQGLRVALNMMKKASGVTSILAFSDGRSPIDPFEIETLNTNKTGIFFIAIGNSVDRVRLEATALRNFGFVSYINEYNILSGEMLNVFERIRNPIMNAIGIGFDDPGVYSLYPEKIPSMFAGSDFIISGRYQVPGTANITIDGEGFTGATSFLFEGAFADFDELSRRLWAAMAIDDLEAQILIRGENDSLKNRLTTLSLEHNIRCRYTAYTESVNNPDTIFEEPGTDPWDIYIPSIPEATAERTLQPGLSAYPCPFTDYTRLRFDPGSSIDFKQCAIRIYDITGILLYEIDLTHRSPDENSIILNGEVLGNRYGVFIVHLVVDDQVKETLKLLRLP